MFFVGAGVKLPTGEHDIFDMDKYDFDRSKAITGEYSETDGFLPPSFQLGTGTTDVNLGFTYSQRFWRLTPTAGFVYTVSGGANSLAYERSDKISWNVASRFAIHRFDGPIDVSAKLGVSGILALGHDVDHSENTRLLGSQERGFVEGSQNDYVFADLGVQTDWFNGVNFSLIARFPLGATGDSEISFNYQIAATLSARF